MKNTVAIVIPCRNEEQYIQKCIDSILQSNYPKELLSIYVCDGMSDSFKTWKNWYMWLIRHLLQEGYEFVLHKQAINELENQ